MAKKEVIVVGGGLAGLSCAMKLAESGIFVKLVSLTPCRRSHSACAQGGINASFDSKGEGDSPLVHAWETIKGSDFLADQPPVVEMCLAAPSLIHMMERFGCPFNRTPEGNLDVRRFGGSLYNRTVFCGASTGQQLLYSLDEQVRRYEVAGLVEKFEHHDFLRAIFSEERISGAVLMDLFNMKIEYLKADALVVATGGIGALYRKSTNSMVCTGAANARLFMQGMKYANPEFIQIHPTAIPGEDKLRLISESARGEGGRIWVPGDSSKKIMTDDGREIVCGRTGEPWYFLEELYPAFGNLVPRDIAAREVYRISQMGLGVDGKEQVYLDVTALPEARLKKLEAILEIYKKFTGEDPKKMPMRIFPAMHYSMGGAWVDFPAFEDPDRYVRFRHMTNLRGLFNVGESDYLYHGANRLGANSLLSCLYGGLMTGVELKRYLEGLASTYQNAKEKIYDDAVKIEEERREEILSRRGPENIHKLHEELASWMVKYTTVERNNRDLQKTLDKIKEIRERQKKITLDDTSRFANQTYAFANQFESMCELALIIAKGALLRDESRGSHSKKEFPKRDDAKFLKTTIAEYAPDESKISYVDVDTRYVKPVLRDYTKAEKSHPQFEGLPEKIPLPL
jgi:succinate dehydrogenase / fumarate reductase, flavoprotein subunit